MKKIKLAILTLLGFSTACSTVKQTTKGEESIPVKTEETTPQTSREGEAGVEGEEVVPAEINRIKLMYGVPSPRPTAPQTTEPTQPSEE